MLYEHEKLYPDCPVIIRIVKVGGNSKSQLIHKLEQSSILMNEYAERLLADEKFTISDIKYSLETVELPVCYLGFPDGATTNQIYSKAREFCLELCPVELGPYLRLEYLNQPEGNSGKSLLRNQAPQGSVTIASEILTEDDEFPKGFYLRKINGVLWLRGYCADHMHVWKPDDHFIFCKKT
ncbi:helicase [Bacillus massiliglaciei]|uniref:helicase n=1 Tax=Bacillus massiliglaciei TaxID=1816693 RepID=UPI000AD6D105|nr:helicase [Bacillus massiliglaciei]